jgi:uncharacterized phage infection (PIP) family protein YhgE
MAEFDLRNTAGEGPGDNSLNQSMKSFENSTLNFTFATAKFSKIEQGFEKATSNFQRVTGSIEKAATNLKEISSSISKASDRFVKSADKISDLGTSIKKASDVMSKNSDVLSDAGKTFSTAINGLVASIEQLTKNIASGPSFTGAAKKPAKKESPKAKAPEIKDIILDISEDIFLEKPQEKKRQQNPALRANGKPYDINIDNFVETGKIGKIIKLNQKEIADQVAKYAKITAGSVDKIEKAFAPKPNKETRWDKMSEAERKDLMALVQKLDRAQMSGIIQLMSDTV